MPYQGQSLVFEDYFSADVSSVDRPDPVGKARKRLPFWVQDDPVFNKYGKIERGGMFPHQRAWWNLPSFVKVLVAGFGCIAGETKILNPETGTEQSAEELCRAGKPIRVLSLFPDGHTEVRDASAPFVKGEANLYRVVLEDGRNVVVTDKHRFLTPQGWASLASGVYVGQQIGCVPSPRASIGGTSPQALPRDVFRCSDKAIGYPDDYSACSCPDDGLLPSFSDDVLTSFPSPGGAPGYTHWKPHPGDPGHGAGHIRSYRNAARPSKRNSYCQIGPLLEAPGCPASSTSPEPLPGSSQGQRPSPSLKALVRRSLASTGDRWGLREDRPQPNLFGCGSGLLHRQEFVESGLGRFQNTFAGEPSFPQPDNDDEFPQDHEDAEWIAFSFQDPNHWIRVSKIEFVRTDKFYDLTVPGPANYLAEGVWHHNSGKTMIGAKRIIATALENAPVAVAAVSPTFPLARKTIVPTIEALLAGKRHQYGKQFWYKYNKGFHFFTIRYKGRTATIYILSGEDPDSLRGPNLGAAWLDEPFLMERAVFDHMIARIRHPDATVLEMTLTGCVSRNSWVTTARGLCRIGDLDPGSKIKQFVPINQQVIGERNCFHKVTKFFNNGMDETVRMTLTNGYELEGTPDHPVLCMGVDGVPVYRRMGSRRGKYAHLEQVRLGDRVALVRGADIWGNQDPLAGFDASTRVSRKCRYQLKGADRMTPDLAYFLGLWLAEGSIDLKGGRVGISCGDQSVRDFVCKTGVLGIKFKAKHNVHCAASSCELIALMKHLGMPLTTAPNKRIPQWVFAGRKEWALAFLAGMYDGDGHVCRDGGGIGYTTTSHVLAEDLQQLLLNLGIVSHRDSVWNAPTQKCQVWSLAHHVKASTANAGKLAEMIPLRIKRKRDQLKRYIRDLRDSDKIPGQAGLISRAWESRESRRWRKGQSSLEPNKILESARKGGGGISYSTAADFVSRWRANESSVPDEIKYLEQNIQDHYYWAEVKRLEKGEAETVDFVIPETHSFTANGVLSLNTPEQLGWGFDLCMGDLKEELKENGGVEVGMIQASTRANLALSPSYVKRLEGSFTTKMVEAFVEGNFVNLSEGLVYYAFTPKSANELECNVRELPEPDSCELGVGLDFNVNPMAASVFWRAGAHMHFFDEIELPNADTEYMMQVLRERFVDETRETRHILEFVYPDASGSARKTSSPGGKTDFHYIRDAGFTINAPTENPKRKDRYNAVNGKFKPKEGRTTLTISPKCKRLVKYLQTYTHEDLNKQERMSHLLDSFGYPIYRLFPISVERAGVFRLAGT